MEKLLSIILPIHNGEKYILKCVNSILKNTYENFEIILVENGSTDRSGEICTHLEKSDSRIRYTVSPKGLSNARNRGINVASGEYIAFIDVDDYVAPDIYKQMIAAIEYTQSDLALCGIEQGSDEKYPFHSIQINQNIYTISQDDYYRQCFLRADMTFSAAWNKIYRTDTIKENNIYFDPELLYAEDREYLARYILHCCKICFCKDKLYYYYCGNQSSICNTSTNLTARMDQIHSLQKSLLLFTEGSAYFEYVNACLLQNADFRLHRAKECNLPDQIAELKPIIAQAEKRLRHSRHLGAKVKYRFLLEHSYPRLFNTIVRISGK